MAGSNLVDMAYPGGVADGNKVFYSYAGVFMCADSIISAIYCTDGVKQSVGAGFVDIKTVVPEVAANHVFESDVFAFAAEFNTVCFINIRLCDIGE